MLPDQSVESVNLAATKYLWFVNPPDPPLGLNRLLGHDLCANRVTLDRLHRVLDSVGDNDSGVFPNC